MKKILLVIIILLCCCFLSACIPPFIDGTIESEKFFNEQVKVNTYQIDASHEEGFNTIIGNIINLNLLTDSDELNINSDNYLSFEFETKDSINIKKIAFMIKTNSDSEMIFAVECCDRIYKSELKTDAQKKEIVIFDNLQITLGSKQKLTIKLLNPISCISKYILDTVVFMTK